MMHTNRRLLVVNSASLPVAITTLLLCTTQNHKAEGHETLPRVQPPATNATHSIRVPVITRHSRICRPSKPNGAALSTLRAFATAVKRKDKRAFLGFISKSHGLVMRDTNWSGGVEIPNHYKFSYAQLVQNLSTKPYSQNYYNYHFFLEDNSPYDQMDTLVWEVKQAKSGQWRQVAPGMFIPNPPFDQDSPEKFFVQLSQVKGKWYVTEIGTARI